MKLQRLIKLSVQTDQEAFDAACRHFARMTKRAVNGSSCVYETPDGKNHCIVGALLKLDTPDKHQWAKHVGGGWDDVAWQEDYGVECLEDLPAGGYLVDVNGLTYELPADLQNIHDEAANWDEDGFIGWWMLEDLAINYNLNTKVLDAVRR